MKDLPHDMYMSIMSYLDIKDLFNVSKVNNRLLILLEDQFYREFINIKISKNSYLLMSYHMNLFKFVHDHFKPELDEEMIRKLFCIASSHNNNLLFDIAFGYIIEIYHKNTKLQDISRYLSIYMKSYFLKKYFSYDRWDTLIEHFAAYDNIYMLKKITPHLDTLPKNTLRGCLRKNNYKCLDHILNKYGNKINQSNLLFTQKDLEISLNTSDKCIKLIIKYPILLEYYDLSSVAEICSKKKYKIINELIDKDISLYYNTIYREIRNGNHKVLPYIKKKNKKNCSKLAISYNHHELSNKILYT
jgi:hypothetical protein